MSEWLEPADESERGRYARTAFLERIAHELRGPAGVTLGALDEIERALASVEGDDSRSLLLMARRGVRRILRTAERLSRTAQLESGPLQLHTVLLDVRDLVANAAREAEQIEGRSSVQVELVLDARPCTAHVDPAWLSVALMELVSQAVRSARRLVQVQVSGQDGTVRIGVHDDRAMETALPSVRFVPIRDKRDCALGWPLALDIAHAHGGELCMEWVRGGDPEKTVGAQASLRLKGV